MRNATGLALFVFGAWLAYSAFAHRARVIAAWRSSAAPAEGEASGNPQPSMLREIMRPIIVFALAYLALKTIYVYVVLEADRWLSLFDLAGFLFLLAAYASWVVVRTKSRAVPGGVPVDPAADSPAQSVAHLRSPDNDRVPEMAA